MDNLLARLAITTAHSLDKGRCKGSRGGRMGSRNGRQVTVIAIIFFLDLLQFRVWFDVFFGCSLAVHICDYRSN